MDQKSKFIAFMVALFSLAGGYLIKTKTPLPVLPNNPAYTNCVIAEEAFLQGGTDTLLYAPALGDTTRARMWTDQHITGADKSYGPPVQICTGDSVALRKVLSSSYGPGLSMIPVDSTHQVVVQGLPGPSDNVRLMLFSHDSLIENVVGARTEASKWAKGLDTVMVKPATGLSYPFPALGQNIQYATSMSVQRWDDPRPNDPAPRYLLTAYTPKDRLTQFEILAPILDQITKVINGECYINPASSAMKIGQSVQLSLVCNSVPK